MPEITWYRHKWPLERGIHHGVIQLLFAPCIVGLLSLQKFCALSVVKIDASEIRNYVEHVAFKMC